MKTTLIRCVNACMAVNYLSQMEWDYKTAFTLARLRRALQPQSLFSFSHRKSISGTVLLMVKVSLSPLSLIHISEPTRRSYIFKDPADAPEYNTRRFELANVETEIDWKPAAVPEPQKIKPIHLEALEGFIRFGGDGA